MQLICTFNANLFKGILLLKPHPKCLHCRGCFQWWINLIYDLVNFNKHNWLTWNIINKDLHAAFKRALSLFIHALPVDTFSSWTWRSKLFLCHTKTAENNTGAATWVSVWGAPLNQLHVGESIPSSSGFSWGNRGGKLLWMKMNYMIHLIFDVLPVTQSSDRTRWKRFWKLWNICDRFLFLLARRCRSRSALISWCQNLIFYSSSILFFRWNKMLLSLNYTSTIRVTFFGDGILLPREGEKILNTGLGGVTNSVSANISHVYKPAPFPLKVWFAVSFVSE